jgi:hypothetical protein
MSVVIPAFLSGDNDDETTEVCLKATYAALLNEARARVNQSLTYPNGSTSASAEGSKAQALLALAQEVRQIYIGATPLTITPPVEPAP